MALVERLRELWHWLVTLPPDFAFLLSLPFLVALTAMLARLARTNRANGQGE